MFDLIIIGAGPAGLTSALYALRANKKVLVLEAKSYGGQIVNASLIENYPGIENITGFEYATNLYNQVKKLGVEYKNETVINIDENKNVTTNKAKYSAKAIIIATGAENRKLNVNNEEKYIGKGVSYCATCDGNFYKNKIAAVVGGGNTALEDAIYLSNICSKVYLIHRRDEFRGEDKYLEELKNKSNVEFILNSNVVNIIGDEKLSQIEIKNNLDKRKIIDIDGLFIAVGQTPNNLIFKNIIELDEN
jgi:thioredoxin reductase (NADPH)